MGAGLLGRLGPLTHGVEQAREDEAVERPDGVPVQVAGDAPGLIQRCLLDARAVCRSALPRKARQIRHRQ